MSRLRHWRLGVALLMLGLAGCGGGGGGTNAAAGDDARAAVGLTPVLIAFSKAPGQAEEALVQHHGGQVKYRYTLVHGIAASLPDAAIEAVRRNPNVSAVDPDITMQASDAELDLAWGVKQIGAGEAHADGHRGAGIKVAILDTGIDTNHPDLVACYQGGLNFTGRKKVPEDDNGHGTHVAGTIAAADNGDGVIGVAPDAQVYALKVLDRFGYGSVSNIIAALEWCVDNGMQVTNNSYGGLADPGPLMQEAFDACEAAGIINVCAAGNKDPVDQTPDLVNYPARYASCIAVAATDYNDYITMFSCRGPAVELAAPGFDIPSCRIGGGVTRASGTSMASPHVAGAVAVCLAAGIGDPRTTLAETALDVGLSPEEVGAGRIDLAEALADTDPEGGDPGDPGDPGSGGTLMVAIESPTPAETFADRQTVPISALVTEADTEAFVEGANVSFVIALPSGKQWTGSGVTDGQGRVTISYKVNVRKDGTGEAVMLQATASKAGYTDGSATTTFAIQ